MTINSECLSSNAGSVTGFPHFITGGGRRLGLAIIKHLVHQGEQVIMSYRTHSKEVDELRSLGVHCIKADFTSKKQLEKLISEIRAEYSGLRSIIHNASDWASEADELDLYRLMERMWQVHVAAPYQINMSLQPLLCHAADQIGIATDIIHLTDFVAEKGSDKHIAYASSKAGLANLSVSFSRQLAPKVKVNAIAPSLLMFQEGDNKEYQQKALKKSLLCLEPGEQEGVAAVQYLLNSRYMTGRTLALDGGRHLA
ncbi:dihydromonapterin reductase [Marinomonas ostreistagni]|uniref:Dihydromonapterin reductase n=1 Tax=Marinomonas ostreistagni TaxID=359209 RepID=A0ABS0ZCE4_9GAMM|nr:dihydromonapterin reductase [Marinomonas ostreistagni]MBJ7551342.1 dihydromonapterin reductase [Marinomonas ostreistagni]